MIRLRPVEAADAEPLFPLIYQTPVTDTLIWDGPASRREYARALALRSREMHAGRRHIFTIVVRDSGRLIGHASLRPDNARRKATVGLWIGQPYQGQGFGTEVIQRLLDYGFFWMRLEKMQASVFVGNLPSRRIFEKNDFSLEGTVREAVRKRGKPIDEWVFGMVRGAYTPPDPEPLFHIYEPGEWEAGRDSGMYRAASLEHEGFIHCSRREQLVRVANAFYPGRGSLPVLWIQPGLVRAQIRWESGGGEERFPHIYGPVPVTAVPLIHLLARGAGGRFHR